MSLSYLFALFVKDPIIIGSTAIFGTGFPDQENSCEHRYCDVIHSRLGKYGLNSKFSRI